MILGQIFDAINLGILVLDRDLKIQRWNRWMEINSGLSSESVLNRHIFEIFPNLDTPKFRRSCKSVLSFGNFSFFSQKLHGYLFPFKVSGYLGSDFEYMQQTCVMGPLRDENDEIKYLFIYVQDVTEVASFQKKLMDLNVRDSLTGIYNRRFMENKLREEFMRSRRYSGDFSIIMLDIDHFKTVNDTYGHQCGDFILKSLSSRISSLIRNVDYFARYGGEEFCCMLPETPLKSAIIVAERFRTAIMELDNVYDGTSIKITISLGVAGMDNSIKTPEELVQRADEALYRAKRNGRNLVEVMEGAVLTT
jgi:diguanylate cyclase (GGDEF)-like protein/PAS domain S-box-containing protein